MSSNSAVSVSPPRVPGEAETKPHTPLCENNDPRTLDNESQGRFQDEIDLLDIARFLWNLRIYIATGVVLGAAVGILAPGRIVSTKFATILNLRVDPTSLPALTDREKIIAGLNGMMSNPAAVEVLQRHFSERVPEYSTFIERKIQSANNPALYTPGQEFLTSSDSSAKNRSIQFQAGISPDQYALHLTLPFQTSNPASFREALVLSLNEIISQHNAQNLQRINITKADALARTTQNYRRMQTSVMSSESVERQKLHATALKLHENNIALRTLAARLPAEQQSLLTAMTKPRSNENADVELIRSPERLIYEIAAERMSENLFLMALLRKSKIMSEAEFVEFREAQQTLQVELNYAYSGVTAEATMISTANHEFKEAQKELQSTVDPGSYALPSFVVTKTSPLLSFEKFEGQNPNPRLIFLASTLAGAMAFFALGALVFLIRRLNATGPSLRSR